MSFLEPGGVLGAESCLHSPSRVARLCLSKHGNLELLQTSTEQSLWRSGTYSSTFRNATLALGLDGWLRIVPQEGRCHLCESYAWSISPPEGASAVAATRLVVRDTCDFAVVASGGEVWTSGTICESTGDAWRVLLGAVVAALGLSLLLLGLWALVFSRCRGRGGCLGLGRRRGEGRREADAQDDLEARFGDFQDRHVRWILVSASVVYFVVLLTGFALIVSDAERGYNYVPTCTGLMVLVLNGVSITFVTKAVRASNGRVARVFARLLRILLLMLGNMAIALGHPPVQHVLADKVPFYDMLGQRVECTNLKQVTINGSPCRILSNTNVAFLLHMTVHVQFVLPAKEGILYCILSIAAYVGMCGALVSPSNPVDYIELLIASCFAVLLLQSKHRLDQVQRQLFMELWAHKREVIEERVKRYQAEHYFDVLEKRARNPTSAPSSTGGGTDERGSLASAETDGTVDSASLFHARLRSGHPIGEVLSSLKNVGTKEQWLVQSAALDLEGGGGHVLGKGAFGVVRRALWHGTPVAVKSVACSDRSREKLQSMLDELRILRYVRHPNIAQCFGAMVQLEHRNISIVLELVQGVILSDFVKGSFVPALGWAPGPPGISTRLRLIEGICQGLWYLHERSPQVVHGDLKPTNVMVTTDVCGEPGHVKLLDFGLSRMLTRSVRPLGGTVRWMAPEVLEYHEGQVARRDGLQRAPGAPESPPAPALAADIFSFGLLVYFISTGLEPVLRVTGSGSVRAPLSWTEVESGATVDQDTAYGDFLETCCGLAEPMLSEEPEERAEAKEVLARLRSFLQQQPAGRRFAIENRPLASEVESAWAPWKRFGDWLGQHLPHDLAVVAARHGALEMPAGTCCAYHLQVNFLLMTGARLHSRPCSGGGTPPSGPSSSASGDTPAQCDGARVLTAAATVDRKCAL